MRKALRIAGVILLLVCLTAGAVGLLLRSGSVQTRFVRLVTDRLSADLKADVRIGRIKFRFLNRLQLEDVYLSDRHRDTLMWIPRADIRFNPMALRNNELDFTSVNLDRPYISLWQDTAWNNYGFLLEAFSPDAERKPLDMTLRVRNVDVSGARLCYHYLPSDYDIRLSPLDLRLSLPVLSGDSVRVSVDDLSFCARMRGVDAVIDASCHGSPDSLAADWICFSYRDRAVLTGRVRFTDPLLPDRMRVGAECQELYCNRALLESLLSDFLRRPVRLSDELAYLGDMHYSGHIDGRLDNLVLNGAFQTDIGSVSTRARLQTDTSFSDIRFAGEVGTRDLHLGGLFPRAPVGDLTMRSNVNVHYRRGLPLEAEGDVDIQSLVFKDYAYQNVRLQASLSDRVLQAAVTSCDPNCDVSLDGSVLLDAGHPSVEARVRVNHLRLGGLHLLPDMPDQDMRLRASVRLSAKGAMDTWADRLNGQVSVDTFCLANYGHSADMGAMTVRLESDGRKNSLRCMSDYLQAHVKGAFRWTTLPATIGDFAHTLFPRLADKPPGHHQPNDLEFYCYLHHADSIVRTLTGKDIRLPDKQTVKGFVRESEGEMGVQLFAPSLAGGKLEAGDIALSIVQKRDKASLALSLTTRPLLRKPGRHTAEDVEVGFLADACHDSVMLTCRFSETDTSRPAAEIQVQTRLDRYAGKPFAAVHVLPASFYVRDTLWTLRDAFLEYAAADTALSVRGFDLSSPTQFIRAGGVASNRMTDSVRIDMRNFSLGYLIRNLNIEKTLTAGGDMTGWVTLYSLLSQPMLEARLHLPEAYLNSTLLGELDATASLDRRNRRILIGGIARQDNRTIVDLKGKVIPEEKRWELDMRLDSADLHLVNHWTKHVLSDIGGRAFGRLGVYGHGSATWVRARLFGKDAHLTVPATQVRYTFNDYVLLDTAYIAFPNIRVRDDEGHTGTLDGRVTHQMFKNFAYDLRIRTRDMMTINLPWQPQQRVYGRVYATGDFHLYGDEAVGTRLDATAATRGASDFWFNTGVASEAADNSFIDFARPEESGPETAAVGTKPATGGQFLMNLNLNVTPAAAVHLLLDPRSGDGISGRGDGSLRLRWDTSTDDVQLFGTYTLQQGQFSYTAANIIRRDFRISEGSTIIWSGNPVSPILDVTARYAVTASLRDLFGSDVSQLATNRTSVPVECLVYMSDRLNNLALRFGIDLPHSDETVASQVKSVINTDEMLMRQVFYLLVFNRFFTPEYLQNTATGLNDTYSLISSTVTGQINSWLSRLTDMVTIGFNFRTDGEGASASQEYETQFQIRPVSRLSINGNVGYRYNDLSNRPFFGDVDVEYELTGNGKLRVKGFTHTVDKYSLKQANTVQGFGLVFRHDFNWGDTRRAAAARRRQKQLRSSEKNAKDQQKTDHTKISEYDAD